MRWSKGADAVYGHAAGGRLQNAREHFDGGGLPGTVFPIVQNSGIRGKTRKTDCRFSRFFAQKPSVNGQIVNFSEF